MHGKIQHSLSKLLIKLIFVRKSGANGQSHCDGESQDDAEKRRPSPLVPPKRRKEST